MPTLIQRPTKVKAQKNASKWRLYGAWGERLVEPMSANRFRRVMYGELVASGRLSADSLPPSNSNHGHVTAALMESSWNGQAWVADPPATSAGAVA